MGSTKMPNIVNQLIHFFRRGIGLRGAKETEKATELRQSSSSACFERLPSSTTPIRILTTSKLLRGSKRLEVVRREQLAQESSEDQPGQNKDPQIHSKDKVQFPIKPDRRIVFHRSQRFTNEYTLNVKVPFSVGGLTRTVVLLGFHPDDTVYDIKTIFHEKIYMTYHSRKGLRLNFWGVELQDDRTLGDYALHSGSTVELVVDYDIRTESTIYIVNRQRGGGGFDDNLRISVELPSGKTIDVPLDSSNTIHEVKVEIQKKIGIPTEEQMLLYDAKELDNSMGIAHYDIPFGKRTLRLEFCLPSILTEPPFCMDTIRLWIPTSLEAEMKHQEHRRLGPYRVSAPQQPSTAVPSQPLMEVAESQHGNQNPITDPEMEDLPVLGPMQGIESGNDSGALDEDPQSSMDMPTTSFLKMPLPAIRCSVQACNKSFASQDGLSRHKRYHYRPEQCPGCPKRFGTKTHLDRHINDVHLTTKAFYCSVVGCQYSKGSRQGKFFPRKANLARHVRARHRDDPTFGNLAAENGLENEPPGIANAGGLEEEKTVEVGLTTFVRS